LDSIKGIAMSKMDGFGRSGAQHDPLRPLYTVSKFGDGPIRPKEAGE
jgi:hypothetical protein